MTGADVAAAHRISDIAHRRGLQPQPSAVLQVEIGLDSAHVSLEGPFWSALLNGHIGNFNHDEVVDADNRFPNLWFQSTDEHPTPRQRFHLDVWVAPETAEQKSMAPWPPADRSSPTTTRPRSPCSPTLKGTGSASAPTSEGRSSLR